MKPSPPQSLCYKNVKNMKMALISNNIEVDAENLHATQHSLLE
jgi:hypothetical protein